MARSVDTHRPGCPCPACTNRGKGRTITLGVRVPVDLADWVQARGGVAWVRALLERERAAEARE